MQTTIPKLTIPNLTVYLYEYYTINILLCETVHIVENKSKEEQTRSSVLIIVNRHTTT